MRYINDWLSVLRLKYNAVEDCNHEHVDLTLMAGVTISVTVEPWASLAVATMSHAILLPAEICFACSISLRLRAPSECTMLRTKKICPRRSAQQEGIIAQSQQWTLKCKRVGIKKTNAFALMVGRRCRFGRVFARTQSLMVEVHLKFKRSNLSEMIHRHYMSPGTFSSWYCTLLLTQSCVAFKSTPEALIMVLRDGDIRSWYRTTRSKTCHEKFSAKENKNKNIIDHIERQTDPDHIERREDPLELKGRFGVFARCRITRGTFVCEYAGDLIDRRTAEKRDKIYELKDKGSYMFYFNWSNKCYCLDATEPTSRLGRLINHSRKKPNCKMEIFSHSNKPYLILTATRDIEPNEEILYDYGERNKEAIKANPWLEDSWCK